MNKNQTVLERMTLKEYITLQRNWSKVEFGEGEHLARILKHIDKEVEEVREVAAGPRELVVRELVDIVILALDAIWRQGLYPDEVVEALLEKQALNFTREWNRETGEHHDKFEP